MQNKKLRNSIPMLRDEFLILNSRRAGFTLIEILVSLALLTVMLGAVYGSFFTAQSALERFDVTSLKYHEVRNALDIMRSEIEGAFFNNLQTSDSNQTNFVIEDRDIFGKTISRLYLTAFSFRGIGLNAVSYYVQEKDGRLILVKTETPEFMLLTDGALTTDLLTTTGYTLEMVEGIEGFTVETLFGNRWVKTWDTKKIGDLPEIVRFTIEFDDKGKKVKLTEYAKPKVGKNL